MGTILDVLNTLRGLVPGNHTLFGDVYPPRNLPPVGVPNKDARTIALELLGDYIAELTFKRPGPKGGTDIPFQVRREHFFVDWPTRPEELVMPSITVVHSRARCLPLGLTSYVAEETTNVYAPGTVVQCQAEYRETINLEIWCEEPSQRHAILGGLETAFMPSEQISGVRFVMKRYFNQKVTFDLTGREVIDTESSTLKRRVSQVELAMRLVTVRLVPVQQMRPEYEVYTNVDAAGVAFDLSSDPTATYRDP